LVYGVNGRAARAAGSILLPSIVFYGVNNRAATAAGSFTPLRYVQDLVALLARKKGPGWLQKQGIASLTIFCNKNCPANLNIFSCWG